MKRISFRIVGASGQGINSIGDIVSKALKRSGFAVFGYREYPSLIVGGHAGYQFDVSDSVVRSSAVELDAVLALNYQGLTRYFAPSANAAQYLKAGGYLIHAVANWKFSEEHQKIIAEKKIRVVCLPIEQMLKELDAPLVLQNVIFAGFLWELFGQDIPLLQKVVGEQFAKKPKLIDINLKAAEKGFTFRPDGEIPRITLPAPKAEWKDHLLITGNEAIGLGAIHAGVRMYTGYPMTPASSLLGYVAKTQNATGMIVKQAEDEITAAQMASGASFMGTRAMTGTSGGGFDLMTETLSMVGMIESPQVFILGQRPGPATGVPTWTAQGDLFLAVHAGHGEFPRCVMSVSDGLDAFHLVADAWNLAERYQIPVILLTDKEVAECLFCLAPFDTSKTVIDRGNLVTEEAELQKLKAADRYRLTEDGVSPRWIPGARVEGYDANSDEHTPDGTVTEDSAPVKNMLAKRMRKMETLAKAMPEPELYRAGSRQQAAISTNAEDLDVLLVGWGSTKNVVLDVLEVLDSSLKIGYLHYTYLWPLKTKRFEELTKRAKRTVLIEGNYQGQLGVFLKEKTGIDIAERLLKYDGRPFFFEELRDALLSPAPLLPHRDIVRTSVSS